MTDVALCRVDEIPPESAIGRDIDAGGRQVPLIVVRHGGAVAAYLNSCPHVGVRLEWQPDDFLDITGTYLLCSSHGALFEKAGGRCLAGPCRGAALVPVTTRVDPDGTVWAVAPAALPLTARR